MSFKASTGQIPGMSHSGIGYLFERFPSFTQTFCFREVLALRQQGLVVPVFSIRRSDEEPEQDYPAELADAVTYLPPDFEAELAVADFRRRARKALAAMRRLWGDESEKRRIYEALWLLPRLRERGVHHVHVHFAGIAARTAFWLKRLGGISYSFTAHANDIFCDEPAERLGMLLDQAAFVVTVSNFSANYLREQFPFCATKLHRVYNGIHLDRFRGAQPAEGPPLILSVGRYIEKKGFADLIDACARLGDRPFACKIVGQGPMEEELKQRVVSNHLQDRIEITGPKPESEVAALLTRASIFALPCVNAADGGKDNLPTVIMEAMASSVAVISTRVAGIPEMVADGQTGYLIAERDPAGLADRLRDLIGNPGKARKMGRAGLELCRERFATEVTTAQLAGIFRDEVVNKRLGAPWWRRWFGA